MAVEGKKMVRNSAEQTNKNVGGSESDLAWDWGRVLSATIFASELAFRCVGISPWKNLGVPKKRPVIIYIPNDEGEGAERHEERKKNHDIHTSHRSFGDCPESELLICTHTDIE